MPTSASQPAPHHLTCRWCIVSAYCLLGVLLLTETSLGKQVTIRQSGLAPVPQYQSATGSSVSPRAPESTRNLPLLPDFFDSASPVERPANRRQPHAITSQPTAQAERTPQAHAVPNFAPMINDRIYRVADPFPIDPRKPNSPCLGGEDCRSCRLGNAGRPHQDRAPGGCHCDQRRPCRFPDLSVHWPRPFSAKLDQRFPGHGCPTPRAIDLIDGLSSFKLLNYQRSDNGYCGPGADPFGCLGESQQRATIR